VIGAGSRGAVRSRRAGRWCLPALALAAGCCGGERIAECDALVATLEQARACGRLEASQRVQIEHTVRSIKESLDRLEDVSPRRAPAAVLDEARRTCARQDTEIRRVYEKDAPECLR
jgi:hypothetical protein